MADVLYFAPRHKGSQISDPRGDHVVFNSDGYAFVDDTDTGLVAAIEEAGAVLVDSAPGTEETVTGGTAQTATTCSAIYMHAGGSGATLNIRNEDANGTLLVEGIVLGNNESIILVFPEPLDAPDGIFVEEESGGLDSAGGGDGFLIP